MNSKVTVIETKRILDEGRIMQRSTCSQGWAWALGQGWIRRSGRGSDKRAMGVDRRYVSPGYNKLQGEEMAQKFAWASFKTLYSSSTGAAELSGSTAEIFCGATNDRVVTMSRDWHARCSRAPGLQGTRSEEASGCVAQMTTKAAVGLGASASARRSQGSGTEATWT